MKSNAIAAKLPACLFVLFQLTADTAISAGVQEPDTFNVVVYIDPISGKFVPLERQTAVVSIKSRAFGLGGVKEVGSVSGTSSPVQFSAGVAHQFAVRMFQGADPNKFRLFKFSQTSNGREVILMSGGMAFNPAHDLKIGTGTVHFDASVLGPSSFKFSTDATLPAGEYGFSAQDPPEVYLFSLK